jgi:hypothetical protein
MIERIIIVTMRDRGIIACACFVLALLFAGGIGGAAYLLSQEDNDFVKANCQITYCNQTTTVCSYNLCYETILEYVVVVNGQSYYGDTTLTTYNTRGPTAACPNVGTVVTCYYHNEKTIQKTLTLRSLYGQYETAGTIVFLGFMCTGTAVSLLISLMVATSN